MEYSKHLLYAHEAGDAQQVEGRAHALKGASSNICAGPVREAAQLLERAGRSEAPQLYKVFKKEFKRLLEHLNSLPPPSA